MQTFLIRLNKFVSSSGLCSRRKADQLILSGQIAVNGQIIHTVGLQIPCSSIVTFKGGRLTIQPFKYYLLNKPAGYVTTTQDPLGRRTVLDLLGKNREERIYPVGRLDYYTTGLLLLTNDGLLAQSLAHPSNQVKKRYHVTLDKCLTPIHFNQIQRGILLKDGEVMVDHLIQHPKDPCQLEVTLHIGRNRIVRRLFACLGYRVIQLDRIGYAHFTKRGIPYGGWIQLSSQEMSKFK